MHDAVGPHDLVDLEAVHPEVEPVLDRSPVVVGDILEGFADLSANAARAVDEGVDRADPIDERRHLLGVGDVARVPVDTVDSGSVRHERGDDRRADSTGAARDETDASAQVRHRASRS